MDPESDAGGVIGWVTTSSLPPTLSQALAKARKGVVVGPVQAVGGWHVLKLLGRRAASVQPLAAARPAIVAQLTLGAPRGAARSLARQGARRARTCSIGSVSPGAAGPRRAILRPTEVASLAGAAP